ncbi:MAG: SMC family ATPase [Elainellaceae cyanobacterium]
MEILAVTLKNFKSHSDRYFAFQPGTNAICGENGAGKTSILEAIAWTLFNYRGAYKNEDLIRNGANSAQAVIEFVSSRDGRTYAVKRCTSTGYTLYDPQLGENLEYKRIEDEIMPWLRQHLGVAPGTDLGRLFANTIGVPQGTFTADFLQATENRKKIFDSILKVEEYRQTNQNMLSLEKYAKAEVECFDRAIAQYEESLEAWEPLQQRRDTLHQAILKNEATLKQLQDELAKLQVEKNRLATQAQQVQQFQARLQQLSGQTDGKQQAIVLLEQSVQQAKQAVQLCETHRQSHQLYRQAETMLQQLDQQFKQRQALLKQREQQQRTLTDQHRNLTTLQLQLDRLTQASASLEQLAPLIQQQEALEQQQTAIVEQLNQLQAHKLEHQNLARQFTKYQSDIHKLTEEVARLQRLQASLLPIADLEQKRDRLQEQLSRVEAAKQFEAELRRLVSDGEDQRDRHQLDADTALATLREMQQMVPLLATDSVESALAAIQAGVDLNTELLNALWRILADLSEQVSTPKLQQQLQQVKAQLDAAYQQRAEVASLEAKLAQQAHLQDEIEQLQARLQQLKQQLETETRWQQQRQQTIAELRQLGDPRGQQQLLERELRQQAALRQQHTALQNQYNTTQAAIAQLDTQLAQFADLEAQADQQKQQRQTHQAGYLAYIQHQKDAEQLPTLQGKLKTAIDELQKINAERQAVQTEYDSLSQDYDPQQWQQVEAQYNQTRSQADQLNGGLPQQRQLLLELDHQLASLQTIAEKRDRAQAELARAKKAQKFITFARKAYKEAGPRITERYVQSISREADRLFRELLNRPNVALEWTRDYEILIQEGAHTRRFINLSGGEQMCAALAVRLALLRVLADIDIAFFDEPTTNMDRHRRESLAEAIANIRSFRQLFVISHDDTFEKVTENVILVEREG